MLFFKGKSLKKVVIPTVSNLKRIELRAFCHTLIKEIYLPANLKELKEDWCDDVKELTKITISPLNGQFILKDDKILLGKSDEKNDEFDILLFACRDVEKYSIPSNIKIISSNAFDYCKKLY